MNWDDLRFVLALRRAGSLGAAARLLKVEPSTASRRLAALESALGAQLASRTPEGLVLNDAGLAAADLAETIDVGIEALLRRIGGQDQRPEGGVRLAATDSMAAFLMGGLVPLRQEHPKIHVELVLGSAPSDLIRHEADLALRMYREQSPVLITRKIGQVAWSVYASRSHIERTGLALGANLEACVLGGLAVIGYVGAAARSPGGLWLAAHSRPEDIVLTGGSVTAVMDATRAGFGLSVLPCYVAHGDDNLVRLTPAVVARSEAFLVIPPDHRDTVRVRVVMDALIALFERERAVLEGLV